MWLMRLLGQTDIILYCVHILIKFNMVYDSTMMFTRITRFRPSNVDVLLLLSFTEKMT